MISLPSRTTTSPKNPLTPEVLNDPVRFARTVWKGMRFYDKQEEILYSLRDNEETIVHSANEMGKDFISSVGIVWFFCSRCPVRIITSSSGETQLKSILWAEIKARYHTASIPLPMQLKDLRCEWMNPDTGQLDPESYLIGHVTRSVENFQGHHLDHDKPRVLAVFDEASGVADEFKEAAESWAHRILSIGNPMNSVNFFFRECKGGDVTDIEEITQGNPNAGLLRKVIHLSGDDSPNVKLGNELRDRGIKPPYPSIIPGVLSWMEYHRRLKKWDKVKQHIRLFGHFWEGAESLLFPPDVLDRAERLHHSKGDLKPVAMGVDCGAGRDLSVWTVIGRQGIIFQHAEKTPDTTKITMLTKRFMKRFDLNGRQVCFDAGGGGKQIVDHLRKQGRQYKGMRAIWFGAGATPIRPSKSVSGKIEDKEEAQVYKNRRAEMYGLLRDLLNEEITPNGFSFDESMQDYHLLREELAILPYLEDNEGRLFLPPKDPPARKNRTAKEPDVITLKSLLGRSPDRADSLVLAVFAYKNKPKIAGAVLAA